MKAFAFVAQRLGRERLDRVLDAGVEGAALGGERPFGLGERALRLAGLEGCPIAVGERPAQRDG